MDNFDLHAFISYAHIDNQPLTAGQKGWVSQFHATLKTLLSQRMGEEARIWRDDKLDGNDVFDQEIIDQFAKTALLISILSPRYLRSDWCTRELNTFAEAATRTGGVTVGNKSRVFKVVKTPLDPDVELPPLVGRTLGYEFYSNEGNDPEEIDPAFGERSREEFLRRISRLAVEMAQSLRAMMAAKRAGGAVAPASKATVFLAACGRDMHATWEQLARGRSVRGTVSLSKPGHARLA